MNKFKLFIFNIAFLLLIQSFGKAQEIVSSENCDLSGFVTYGQGGWGSPSKSVPGKIRDQNFSTVFPEGLLTGSIFTLRLNSSEAVSEFLPQRRTPFKLAKDYIDPVQTSAGVLGGQLVAALLNYHFNLAGLLGTNTEYTLGELIITEGPFEGKSVKELIDVAGSVFGGEEKSFSYSEINYALTLLNENFDNGSDRGFLVCPPEVKRYNEPVASLGDKVWLDKNRSGIQESWETGLAGVTVKLFECQDILLEEKVTDENGFYIFENISPGDYYIEVVLPDGYYFSNPHQGTDDGIDSDTDPVTGKTDCVNLSENENNFSVDAGLYNNFGVIGDKVWLDVDNNGLQTRDEEGLSGISVRLFYCEGNLKSETSTDDWGYYYFENVKPGFYRVQFVLPEGYEFTLKDAGLNNGIDSDAGVDGFTVCMEISPGESDKTWDAGLKLQSGSQRNTAEYVNKLNSPDGFGTPAEFSLLQNYPNPFNPETVIEFSIVTQGNYTLKVYNLLGQEIRTLFNDILNPGSYFIKFDGQDLLSGTYFYNLSGNGVNLTRKMSLVK